MIKEKRETEREEVIRINKTERRHRIFIYFYIKMVLAKGK